MNLLDKHTTAGKILLISMIGAVFIVYPNIACFSWDLKHIAAAGHTSYMLFFIFRLMFFTALIWLLIKYNLTKIDTSLFKNRLFRTLLITGIAYLTYVAISMISGYKADCFTGLLLFQFIVTSILCAFAGHASFLYYEQRKKEQEIEQLKFENLRSRCDALTNQINPHFFFNSLNGLTSLIRKKNENNSLEYVDKLSDVFRYILQSDKKGLVTLEEELEFVQAFRYMMEVRFQNKLSFNIIVEENKRNLKIPVLSLLPLIDNVVVHNTIDSEHKMEVKMWVNDDQELVVSNPVFPKISPSNTNGTGLKNLENRFSLLMNQQIRFSCDDNIFYVYLPLN